MLYHFLVNGRCGRLKALLFVISGNMSCAVNQCRMAADLGSPSRKQKAYRLTMRRKTTERLARISSGRKTSCVVGAIIFEGEPL